MGNSDHHKPKEKFEKVIGEISDAILEHIDFSFGKHEFETTKDVKDWKDEIKQYITQNLNSNNRNFKQLLEEMKQSLKNNNREEKMSIDNYVDYPYNEKNKHDQYKDINYNHTNRNINEKRVGDNKNKNYAK